jgi:hypothetical protein
MREQTVARSSRDACSVSTETAAGRALDISSLKALRIPEKARGSREPARLGRLQAGIYIDNGLPDAGRAESATQALKRGTTRKERAGLRRS